MQNNVTACQKAQCVFHGMSREGDWTAFMHRRMLTSKLVGGNHQINSYHIVIGTMTYQARGIIKAYASVCVEGGGDEKF